MALNGTNSDRQRLKKIKRVIEPFLTTVTQLADKQISDNHEFVVEIPLALSNYTNKELNKFVKRDSVNTSVGKSYQFLDKRPLRKATWWLSSGTQMVND